jgi:anti-sigma regulatory factor (Ser/Thr protein kinase)
MARELGMDETRRGAVALAATEMATNVLKHAGKGYILLQTIRNGHNGLSLVGVDKGPGIADITKALGDGHSTAGSMGSGLGAIRRLADKFDLYSVPGAGTVIAAEFWQENQGGAPDLKALETRVVSEPLAGETVSGDGWGMAAMADSQLFMVVDGLGHGFFAAEAAREAERVFAENSEKAPAEIVRRIHAALKKTRGAALGIARVHPENGVLAFAGVGNISAAVIAAGTSRQIASQNGIVGLNAERVQEYTVPWNQDSILVLHSDGLNTRWDLARYPGLATRPPALIAGVLHRDFSRGRDDVTVLIAKAS